MFKVEKKEAINFAQIWSNKYGLVLPLDDNAIQFATDFSNIVLNNFIQMCQKEAEERIKASNKKPIIIEGV